MAFYNLRKAADRKRYRQERVEELNAVKEGTWPRDINDEMRWNCISLYPLTRESYVYSICKGAVAYIDDLETRIKNGDPEVEEFEQDLSETSDE